MGDSIVMVVSGPRRLAGRADATCCVLAVAMISTVPAYAQETINYGYDALGRVTTVNHSGSVNNGVQQSYTHDAVDNRTNVTVTGAASAAKVIVVPLNGLTVIPIPAQ